jgi:phosphate-selective porin OprO and OprP
MHFQRVPGAQVSVFDAGRRRAQLEHRRNIMSPSTRLAVLAVLALPMGNALAQTSSTPDTATLLKKIEEQDRRIEALEHKLEVLENQQAAANGAGANPTGANGAATGGAAGKSSAAGTQAVGPAAEAVGAGSVANRGRQPTSAPPVPQTTGALPGSPSTAIQGSTAAVSQRAATASEAPGLVTAGSVKAGATGFSFASEDSANVIRFRGNFAFDGRWFPDHVDPVSADTFLFRKVRPIIEGTIDNDYDFRFMPEFGGGKSVILDAFVTARIAPGLAVQAGKFKGPVGLERLQPDQYNRFMELGLPSDLVPNRDLGVEIGGDFLGGTFGYAVGEFVGVADGTSSDANANPDADSNDGKKDTEGRLFTQPFVNSGIRGLRGLGFGIAGTHVRTEGSPTNTLLTSYKTTGQNTFFSYRSGTTGTYADGNRTRWTPQAYYFVGPFGALAEYVESEQDVSRQLSTTSKRSGKVDNSAYQLLLSYFLTGENSTYNSFTPKSTFHFGRPGWGALEVVARYSELRIDDAAFDGGAQSFADPNASARRARAAGVGLNWWLNANVKWVLDYEVTRFDGGAANGTNRPNERALTTRFALTF